MRFCGSLCPVGNAVRLFHLGLTFFVFYVLLTNPRSGEAGSQTVSRLCQTLPSVSPDLHLSWQKHTAFFVLVICLLSLALLLYLTASCMDPGYLAKAEPQLMQPGKPSPNTGKVLLHHCRRC